MHAFRLFGPDDPNRWVYEEALPGEPAEGEIQVHAAGLINTEMWPGRFFIVEPNARQLDEVARLIDSGVIRPIVGKVFRLTDARQAYQFKPEREGGPASD